MGLLLRYDLPELAVRGDDKTSPFTLGLAMADIPGSASAINAAILIALLSAANSSMYSASRTLMALASKGDAPAIFKRTHNGVPIYAMVPSIVLGLVFVVIIQLGPNAVVLFDWLLNIAGFTVAITWAVISIVHLRFHTPNCRFRASFVAQGRLLDDLPYVAWFYPYGDLIAIGGILTVIVGQGAALAATPDRGNIMAWLKMYLGLLLFPVMYLSHKYVTNSSLVPLLECDFTTTGDKMDSPEHSGGDYREVDLMA